MSTALVAAASAPVRSPVSFKWFARLVRLIARWGSKRGRVRGGQALADFDRSPNGLQGFGISARAAQMDAGIVQYECLDFIVFYSIRDCNAGGARQAGQPMRQPLVVRDFEKAGSPRRMVLDDLFQPHWNLGRLALHPVDVVDDAAYARGEVGSNPVFHNRPEPLRRHFGSLAKNATGEHGGENVWRESREGFVLTIPPRQISQPVDRQILGTFEDLLLWLRQPLDHCWNQLSGDGCQCEQAWQSMFAKHCGAACPPYPLQFPRHQIGDDLRRREAEGIRRRQNMVNCGRRRIQRQAIVPARRAPFVETPKLSSTAVQLLGEPPGGFDNQSLRLLCRQRTEMRDGLAANQIADRTEGVAPFLV